MDIIRLKASAKTIRALSIDAIEKAQSGHPGLPMGCAEIGSYLFAVVLQHYPDDLKWVNRDRFILSAGHGSMLLYSLMYMCGYGLTLDDIKNFRQLKGKTPGHPEYGWTEGVETSTGPLGQGLGNGVGMAIAGKIHSQKFNKEGLEIFNNRIFVIAGDGDLMEGLSYEACSIAGHLKLNNLIVIYDSNKISIEGSTDIAFTENITQRFKAFNWHVTNIDGHDFKDINRGFEEAEEARKKYNKPVLIIADTTIGKGSPNKEGTNLCHGAPLGAEECGYCKEVLGIDEHFHVDPDALKYYEEKKVLWKKKYLQWQETFAKWSKKYPHLRDLFDKNFSLNFPEECFDNLPEFSAGDMIATRNASNKILNTIVKDIDFVVSGSADLAGSTKTKIKDKNHIKPNDFSKHNIQYGVREHAMAAIANGLYLYGGIFPIIGTFLSFVEYMKPAIRMAAMMRIPVTYLFSHDSIYVGEDGPTHQPIEHITGLRIIPNLNVMRPADAYETRVAWEVAFKSKNTPSAIITTRQKVPVLGNNQLEDYHSAHRGGYIIKKEKNENPDIILIATGSEISITLKTALMLEEEGFSVRVVSMFSMFLYEKQDKEYRDMVLPPSIEKRMVIEAGIDTPWYKYIGFKGDIICIKRMGISGKAEDVGKYFGFTSENIYNRAKNLITK